MDRSCNEKTITGKTYVLSLVGFCILVILDQITKFMAVHHLEGSDPLVIMDGVFELRYLENRGAAFGMMQNMQPFFIAATVAICILIVILYRRIPFTKRYYPLRICAVFLCGGAFGNLIDRVRLNYVIDFLYFRLINFPIFNLADSYVVCACIFFLIVVFFYYRREDDFKFLERK